MTDPMSPAPGPERKSHLDHTWPCPGYYIEVAEAAAPETEGMTPAEHLSRFSRPLCSLCGPGYRIGDPGCQHTPAQPAVPSAEGVGLPNVPEGIIAELIDGVWHVDIDQGWLAAFERRVRGEAARDALLAAAEDVKRIREHGLERGTVVHPTAEYIESWLRERAAGGGS